MMLISASFAQAQTTPSPSETPAKAPSTEKTPAKSPSKAVSELPPPEPAGESAPLTPAPNPFPIKGLGLPLAPDREESTPNAQVAPNVESDETGNEPGYFGAITDDRQKLPGVRIVEVVAGGPADTAGLRAGDLITTVNDQPVREMADLAKVFTASQVGQQLTIVYQRGATLNKPGQDATLVVTLGARPQKQARRYTEFGRIDADAVPLNEADRPSGMILGVRSAPLDLANQRRLGVPIQFGALVLDVTPGSPAALAGIPRDAVIISLNGLLIDSPDDLTREILQAGPGAEVELGYYLGRDQIRRQVVLGGNAQPPVGVGNPPGGNLPGTNRLNDTAVVRIGELERQVEDLKRRLQRLEEQLQK